MSLCFHCLQVSSLPLRSALSLLALGNRYSHGFGRKSQNRAFRYCPLVDTFFAPPLGAKRGILVGKIFVMALAEKANPPPKILPPKKLTRLKSWLKKSQAKAGTCPLSAEKASNLRPRRFAPMAVGGVRDVCRVILASLVGALRALPRGAVFARFFYFAQQGASLKKSFQKSAFALVDLRPCFIGLVSAL